MEVYVMARLVDIGFLRLQTIVAKSDGFAQSGNELGLLQWQLRKGFHHSKWPGG